MPAGKEAAVQTEVTEWIDDSIRELAESYGIEDSDMKGFTSAAEFRRAARLIDQRLAAPPPPPPAQVPAEEEVDLDPQKYIDAGYDAETVKLVRVAKSLQDKLKHIEPAIGQFQALHQAATQQGFANSFHDLVDSMEEGLYGRSVDKNGKRIAFATLRCAPVGL